ncbi:MAG: sodium dependent phosphate transporter [Planctomycetota bacterium]|nr:sodium dependent phosphate transporter [Planctomycetota bacterium]
MTPRRFLDRVPTPIKVLLVFGALYLFIVGIGSMSAAFKLMGKDYTHALLGSRAGPLVALFIGILATSFVQSSSTTTTIIVSLVANDIIGYDSAIYMVMGANVGTTVTNTIVSLAHITRSVEFQRAFAAATVHDFFNMLVLVVLFPLEIATGVLSGIAKQATVAFEGVGGVKFASPIKIITKPVIDLLKDLVEMMGGGGGVLAILGLLMTFATLIMLVKVLRSIMVTKLENLFDRVLFKSAGRALFLGFALTVLVQSSSITTSVAVPLVGAGIITLRQVLPYTMGANVGTTVTALLAAMAALAGADPAVSEEMAKAMLGVRLAFFHVLFNVTGVAILWFVRPIPIKIAESFARLAMWNRFVPIVYLILAFFVIPGLVIWLGR